MLPLALGLSAAMGGVLGLLGGGGSILAVPILLYTLGMPTKQAIAASLLIVAVTSAVGLLSHARRGTVDWRTGLTFGSVAMIGAFLGGWLARYLPPVALLSLLVVMMVVAAVAMLRRPRPAAAGAPEDAQRRSPRPLLLAGEGLVVGLFTGLVGAGGGFIVVPALVLLGGLPMRRAVGTSLLIVAAKSTTGFLGYLAHTSIDYGVVGLLVAAAVTGTLVGTALGSRLSGATLRRAFGFLVLLVAAVMLYQQLPTSWRAAIFVDRWPFWVGGLAVGGFVLLLLAVAGRVLGVSTGFSDLCSLPRSRGTRRSWRLPFLMGIVLGGVVAAALGGGLSPTLAGGPQHRLVGGALSLQLPLLLAGGVLIGFGARLAGGCTSGHSIVGVAQLARSSLVATAAFMGAGLLVTQLLFGG